MSSTFTLPAADLSAMNGKDPQANFAYISPVIDHLFLAPATKGDNGKLVLPSLDFKVHSTVYTLVYNVTTTTGLGNSESLYNLISTHLTEVVKKISDDIKVAGPDGAEQLISHYLEAWTRFDDRATYLHRLSAYLNRHYVKRQEDEGRGAKIVLTTWGYPADGVDKEVAENCAKAASADDALIPIRPLALRKWRLLVAEKLKMELIVDHLKSLEAGQKREKIAEDLKKSFWTVGVEPSKPQIAALVEFLPKAPEPAKAEVAAEVDEKGKGKAPAVETGDVN